VVGTGCPPYGKQLYRETPISWGHRCIKCNLSTYETKWVYAQLK
jgi:hypothetical protein